MSPAYLNLLHAMLHLNIILLLLHTKVRTAKKRGVVITAKLLLIAIKRNSGTAAKKADCRQNRKRFFKIHIRAVKETTSKRIDL